MDIEGMQNARLGTLYLWQGITLQSPIASAVIGGGLSSFGALAGIGEINIPLPSQTEDVLGAAWDAGKDTEAQGSTLATIKAWADDFVKKIWAKIKEVFGDVAEVGGHLKKLASFVAQQVFSSAAPLIGNAVGLVQGLWKTTVAFCEKLGNWLSSRGVKLVAGHPKTLVEGIGRGIDRALLEGIYETAKSALMLGLNIASSGATAVLDVVASVLEAAVKIIWRIAESVIIRNFCDEAKLRWAAREEGNSIHLDSMKFDNWLRGATEKVPVIAAVTLGSGIAGDKMRFLQMYTGEGGVIAQSDFDAGVTYLDQIKRSGSRLIERSGIEFDSDDLVIKGLVNKNTGLAISHDKVHSKKSFWKRLFRKADKIARA